LKTVTTTKAEQVAGWIRALIKEKRFTEGRLPSEPRLALQLGVSRGTLRQAIEQLVRGGLLIRRHGSGTFVNENVLGIQTRLEEVWDFEEMIHTSGFEPGVKHHWLKLVEPERKVAEALHLSRGKKP
jgi:GntR family transcriptional regulator